MIPRFKMRAAFMTSAGLIASIQPAFAQTASPAAGSAGAPEIVVTATRQSQSLSKVAVSISAFTAAKMEEQGVKSFADLVKFTPGTNFDQITHDISIRGISSTAGSGTTGIYVDDTPIQVRAFGLNPNNSIPAVFDLERVEVLRGPQGTLFGAGSEGGTIRYITNQPGLTDFSANVHSELATTQGGGLSYEMGAAVGGPIIKDHLGFRISAWARRDGGWIDQDGSQGATPQKNTNSADTYVLRAALTWKPGSSITITPAINYENRNQRNSNLYWVGLTDRAAGNFKTATPERDPDMDHYYLASLKIDADLGSARLIANTSYYSRHELVSAYSGSIYDLSYFQHFTEAGIDPQGNPCSTCVQGPLLTSTGFNLPGFGPFSASTFTTNVQRNFSQEIRLQSSTPGTRLNWTIGAYFATNYQSAYDAIKDPQLPQLTQYLWGETMSQAWGEELIGTNNDYISDTRAHDRQFAIFGDATYSLTKNLKLNVGLRYAWTHFDFTNSSDGPTDLLLNGGVPALASGGKDETPFTPKVTLSEQLTPDDLVYVTVSKGYRIGGSTPPLPAAACLGAFPTQYNSDTVVNYEAGFKGRFDNRRLSVAASIYHINWNNIQQSVYVPACGLSYTTNSGNATSEGFDLQAQWQLTHHFRLEASVGYTNAHFSRDAFDQVSGLEIAARGDALNVPPWNIAVAAQYDLNVMGHEAYVRSDYAYTGNRTRPTVAEDPATAYYDAGLRPDPAFAQLSLRSGLTMGKWAWALFMNNILNSHPQLYLNHDDSATALYLATSLRPRTVGISLSLKY